ncbi:DegT/DnrJ/EryC1/StrS family aminotransferase [Jeotgalibacillus sp. S-D1]|uniref:DegT/DnrJ/EryC1/StrS family aminotransferase n=1 Tax=Jeotgalibacillus sp. S-D1 TaxID=2552189 RepID=UPI001059D6A2|nr:DegT/DnrJ/EryC1/StrS family aminotransferase [Jeotgalibacillus sp. S-D1]TDL30589.1 DegT/DnrJ/EryC1/StrS family aminotransferase [Jeotgalibacillus sp. S-D1]
MIPLINLKQQFGTIKDELIDEMEKVLLSGQYILGSKVEELEEKIAEKLGVSHAVAVANGTDALILTLDAYGIGKGDEVITTPFTFFATGEAISRVGATPVFVDIDPITFTLCPLKIEEKITPKTKAIIPVHLFGQTAHMNEINQLAKKHNLLVIEDACQAFGAEYKGKAAGSLGDAACFSFFPTKNLGTVGDGGMITTSDPALAKRIRTLRIHGSVKKYFHNEIGYNSRLDELHAAILLTCLKHIDQWNQQRGTIAARYRASLKDLKHVHSPAVSSGSLHVYHLYCLETDYRKEITEYLRQKNVQTGIYYPCCLHLQEAFKGLGYQKGSLPIAEALTEKLFAIPMHPFLSVESQDKVIAAIRESEEILSC